jgi:tetraacyldisaccharide 4'-kinase
MKRPPLAIELFLIPFAFFYAAVMKIRNIAYARGWLSSYRVAVPVLSVGNLTAGGTGKTPLTELLVRALTLKGVRVGIISRGYRGSGSGIERVCPEEGARGALKFGDEPTWLAGRFPQVPVYVGTDKVEVCRKLLSENKVDLIVADDAFQHRRLHREIDVVVIDASEPEWHYRPLPLGRMREGFRSLARAQAVFLSKVNLAEEPYLSQLRNRIRTVRNGLGASHPVFEMQYKITSFASLANEEVPKSALDGKRILLVSGIARPHTFVKLVEEATNAEIADHLVFADHHPYNDDDLNEIENRARSLGAARIVVTEKDAVKMAGWTPSLPIMMSRLEAVAQGGVEEFYEAVRRLVL